MHIKLKKNFIYFYNYKIKCSIGKNGLSSKKKEGDLKTPKGKYKFNFLLYRKDRIKKIQCPFKKSAEKLFLKKNIYDLILVINFNTNPVVKNKGSAIFLHLADKKFKPTKGCIGIKKKSFIKILPLINKKTKIIIY